MKHTTGRGPKDKGKLFERDIVASILAAFPQLSPHDVLARSMGDPGQDIMLSEAARKVLPLALELKRVNRVENLDMEKAFSQAKANCQAGQVPAVVYREDRHEAMVSLRVVDFLYLMGGEGWAARVEYVTIVSMNWNDFLKLLGAKN